VDGGWRSFQKPRTLCGVQSGRFSLHRSETLARPTPPSLAVGTPVRHYLFPRRAISLRIAAIRRVDIGRLQQFQHDRRGGAVEDALTMSESRPAADPCSSTSAGIRRPSRFSRGRDTSSAP